MVAYLGLWVLIALSLNMWALLSVFGSGAGLTKKLIWAVSLFLFPGLAYIAWYLLGPRRAS